MIERILEKMEAIRIVLGGNRNLSHLIPTLQGCDVLQSVAAVLKSFNMMTDVISGKKCITISAIKPLSSHHVSEILIEKKIPS